MPSLTIYNKLPFCDCTSAGSPLSGLKCDNCSTTYSQKQLDDAPPYTPGGSKEATDPSESNRVVLSGGDKVILQTSGGNPVRAKVVETTSSGVVVEITTRVLVNSTDNIIGKSNTDWKSIKEDAETAAKATDPVSLDSYMKFTQPNRTVPMTLGGRRSGVEARVSVGNRRFVSSNPGVLGSTALEASASDLLRSVGSLFLRPSFFSLAQSICCCLFCA